jgi:tetratricopeptide (TPR) repeat protein
LLLKKYFVWVILLLIVNACSNTKYKGFRQSVTNFTAYYNTYFNAKYKFRLGYKEVANNNPEYFYQFYPIFPYDYNTDQFKNVAKFKEIGAKSSKIFTKKKNSKWVDDALLVNGKRFYYSGELDSAIIQFDYIVTNFERGYRSTHIKSGRPKKLIADINYAKKRSKKPISERKFKHKLARNEAIVWLVRAYIRKGNYYEAQRIISNAEADLSFPIEYRANLRKTQVLLHMAKKEYKPAIDIINPMLESAPKKEQSRLRFILAQLYEADNDKFKAVGQYNRILMQKDNEAIVFETQMRMAELAGIGQASATIDELKAMTRKGKYLDRIERIYYAIGISYAKLKDYKNAELYLLKAAQNASKNPNIKFMAFERIGSMYFDAKNYKPSAKYYDSANMIIPASYDQKEEFKQKAKYLIELSKYFDSLQKNDSVLNLVSLGKKEASKRIAKNLAKEKKNKENENIIASTKLEATKVETTGAKSNWYFDNPTQMESGRIAFKKKFGNIKRQENWKFGGSGEIVQENKNTQENSEKLSSKDDIETDDISDIMIADLPFDADKKAEFIGNTQRVIHKIAQIFHYEINDIPEAILYYKMILNRFNIKYDQEEEVLYALYLLSRENGDFAGAEVFQDALAKDYPDSKFNKLISNPNYAKDLLKENEAAENKYKQIFASFDLKNYKKTIAQCDQFIAENKDNPLVPKYKLLKALCHTRYYQFDEYLATLKDLNENHTNSDEYPTAKEWLEYALKVNRDSLKASNQKEEDALKVRENENLFTSNIENSENQVTSIAKEEANVNFFFNANAPHMSLIRIDGTENIYQIKRDIENVIYEMEPNLNFEIQIHRGAKSQYLTVERVNKIFKCLSISEDLRNSPKLAKYNDALEFSVISKPNFDLLIISGSYKKYFEFYKLNY